MKIIITIQTKGLGLHLGFNNNNNNNILRLYSTPSGDIQI